MSDSNTIENLRDFTLERNLDSIAMKFKEESYTYGDLELMSRHMSTWFTAMELKGEPVAFMLPNGFEIMITYLACFKSGAVAMPLSRKLGTAELEQVLIHSGAKTLIVELDQLAIVEDVDFSKTQVKTVFLNGVVPREGYNNFYTLLGPAGQYEITEIAADDPAVIFYTSAKDDPRAVIHSFSSVNGMLSSTSKALSDINQDDRILVLDPQILISGFIETFSGLYYGAYVIVEESFRVDKCVPSLVNDRPTLLTTHTGVFKDLIESGFTNKDTFGSLRGVYTGGKSKDPELHKKFHDHSGLTIGLGYGMTEAIWLTINRELGSNSIGSPIPGVSFKIVGQDGKNVSDGEVGELWVSGNMVSPGYWKNEQATNAALDDSWYKTGDHGFMDENGNITIVQN